ncbi:putative quinol monooxygenase [Winogradskya humida]|uniref:Antibiotic biosynthesis monooxygenase n=1 Tax=Winogradskya humida TaxID=113566 RepID=A0ABQ3ZQG0_9ACTN|nr:putative quinol monooxygenase [Actinoplanes humidus]GIE20815.1 antibiotic biosynthesis monooxygenase [Actinoplanes humidus]
MYGYVGTMRTTPGNRDEVVKLLLSGAEGLRSAGCHMYVVSVSESDLELIHVTEAWESKEQHDASLQLPETRAAIAKAMPLLTGEFTSQELTVVGGLGL